jgi:hypothetical protein
MTTIPQKIFPILSQDDPSPKQYFRTRTGAFKDVVLDRNLEGLTLPTVVSSITSTDTVIQAMGKLQFSIDNAGGGVSYIRRAEVIVATWTSYYAFAPAGSLETDAVWTITKVVDSADGTIVSNVKYLLKKWTERGLL